MAVFLAGVALSLLAVGRPVSAGSLKDIEHVVIFMQENRSWNSVGARIDLNGVESNSVVLWNHGWDPGLQ